MLPWLLQTTWLPQNLLLAFYDTSRVVPHLCAIEFLRPLVNDYAACTIALHLGAIKNLMSADRKRLRQMSISFWLRLIAASQALCCASRKASLQCLGSCQAGVQDIRTPKAVFLGTPTGAVNSHCPSQRQLASPKYCQQWHYQFGHDVDAVVCIVRPAWKLAHMPTALSCHPC